MSSPVSHTSYGAYIDLQNYTSSAPATSGSFYLSGSANGRSSSIYTTVDAYLPGLTLSGASGIPAGGVEVNVILDEDAMGSNDASALATQQSIKAYVDSQVGGADLDFAGDSGTGAVDLDSQTFTIAGTSLEVETAAGSQTLTIGLPSTVSVSGDLTVGVNFGVSGSTTLGNAAADKITVTGQLTASQGADFSKITNHDAGLTSTTITGSGAATLKSLHCDSVNIDGGNIDGTIIGAASVAAGSFAALVATTGDFSGNVTMDGNVTLGDAASDVTTVTAQLTCSQGADFSKITNHDAGLTSTTITGSGAATLASLHCDSVNIDGGNIDGTTIGAAAVAAGSFAGLVATTGDFSGNVTMDGNVTLGDAAADVTTVTSQLTCSQGADFSKVTNHDAGLTSTTISGTIGSLDSLKVNTTIGTAEDTDLLTLESGQIDIAGIVSGSGNANFGGTLSLGGTYSFTDAGVLTIASMGGNWTNASRTVADLGTVTTVDLNGGTIDNTTIGATTATTAKFTTVHASSNLHVLGTGSIYGNVTLGNAASDVTTVTGQLTCSQGADFTKVTNHDDGLTSTTISYTTSLSGTGNVTIGNGTLTVGESANGSDVTFYGDEANNVLLWDVTENALVVKDGGSEIVRMGGDATTDFAIDVGDGDAGTNNINKIRASAFVTFSDERLKTDVDTMDDALGIVNSMKPVNFTWKQGGTRDFGFLAQDLQKVIPQAVHGNEEGMFGVDYGRLTSILVKAIQEQNAQIEALKNKLDK